MDQCVQRDGINIERTKMQRALLLDVIVGKSAAILQLLASEDEALLVWRDALFVLDLGLHIVDGVRGLHFQRNSLARESLDKDLHTATQTQDYRSISDQATTAYSQQIVFTEVKSALLLNVVVRERPSVLKLLSSEDEALLIGRDSVR